MGKRLACCSDFMGEVKVQRFLDEPDLQLKTKKELNFPLIIFVVSVMTDVR